MSKKKWNSLKLGFLLGIAWPLLVMVGFYFWKFEAIDFQYFWDKLFELKVFTKFISICVYPNLLLFFIFIWKNRLLSARGVLLATIVLAFFVMIFKFAI
jgi:hypothetical protein